MAGKTALVVDDSKSARFALRRFLENKGYAVDTAENANEAYAYLKQRRPDVVFMDQMMPGISGFDALRTIRMELELISLPIIICSSNEGDAFVRQARAQGADDVLPKPPNELHINAVLDRLMKAKADAAAQAAQDKPAAESKVTPMAPPKAPEPRPAPPASQTFSATPRTFDIEPATEEELAAIDMSSLDLPIEETPKRVESKPAPAMAGPTPPATPAPTPTPAPAPAAAAAPAPTPAPAAAPTPAPTPAPAPAMAKAAAPEPVQTTTATGAPKMEQKVVSMAQDSAAKGGSEIERKLKDLADRIEALNKTVGALGNRLEPILRSGPVAPAKNNAPVDPSLSRVNKSVVEATNKLGDIEAIVQSLIERSDV